MYKDKDKANQAAKERMRRYRNKGVTEGVTTEGVTEQGVTPELCRYCGTELPKLQKPRCYPGACYPCAIAQPSKQQPCATAGHTVSSRPISESGHELTVMERLFYRPAHKPGEHNFVSLPGRACYGVFE